MSTFIELSLILCSTVVISYIARLLKQPLVVGYILSGILVGPYALNMFHITEEVELFSKIGIAILLFIVGMSLSPATVKETGKVSVIVGTVQVLLTALAGYFVMHMLGFDTRASLIGAAALTFSSTIIILKLLSDTGDLHKLCGKMAIGVLLVQDLAATFVLIIISALGASAATGGLGMMFTYLFLKGVVAGFILYLIAKYVLPKVLTKVASSQELLFLFAIAWGLGMASLFEAIGFSIEIGALVAGVTLSVSSFAYEISSRLRPLRDFFVVLFFILLGAQMVLTDVASLIIPTIVLSLFVFLVKPFIVLVTMNTIGYRTRTSFMTGISMAQISEFSLIMMTLCLSLGYVSSSLVSLITLVGIITIAGSTYAIMYADHLFAYLRKPLRLLEWKTSQKPECDDLDNPEMIIFGYDRVGYDFVQVAKKIKSKYLVVDFNPVSIKQLDKHGIVSKFGDAEDVEFLEEIKLAEAKMIVSTIPDLGTNKLLVTQYRKNNPQGIILVISHDMKQARELYALGATYVIIPHYLGAHHAASMLERYASDMQLFDKERNRHLAHISEREKILYR
ncbi:MAG: cation:proton antiporter [Patescibacteria group bacterium]